MPGEGDAWAVGRAWRISARRATRKFKAVPGRDFLASTKASTSLRVSVAMALPPLWSRKRSRIRRLSLRVLSARLAKALEAK